jgi:hypothetical protein
MFSMENWHGHPCVLVDTADCPMGDLDATLRGRISVHRDRVQLDVVTNCDDGVTTLRDNRDIFQMLRGGELAGILVII